MSWTKIAKPNTSNYTKISRSTVNYPLYGSAVYGTSKYGVTDANTKVAKPSTRSWVNIAKPT